MTSSRDSALTSAHTLQAGKRATAERELADALARHRRSGERVEHAQRELEAAREADKAFAHAGLSPTTTGLDLRRRGAHARAQREHLRTLESALRARKGEQDEQLAAVTRARAALTERIGKERAIGGALSTAQASARRARERREQDEQDELHAHESRGPATKR